MVSSPPHADHGGAQHLPLPAVAGAQHLVHHGLAAGPPSPSACATASCTDGSKGTSGWSTRSRPSLRGCRCSIARDACSALAPSLTSSDSLQVALGQVERVEHRQQLVHQVLRRRARPAPPAGGRSACGSSRSRPGCAGARAGTRPARAPAPPAGRPPRPARPSARLAGAAEPLRSVDRRPAAAASPSEETGSSVGHGLVAEAHCSSTISASTTSSSDALSLGAVAARGAVAADPRRHRRPKPRRTPARRGAG